MKKIAWIALAALAFASCSKPVSEESPPPLASTTPAPGSAATGPAPAPSAPQPSTGATASAPELAPAGVFYLLTPARIETPDGIRGLPPGTGVKLVRTGVYLTPYGETSLKPDQLTNDMGIARRARDADQAAQRAAQGARLAEQARVAAAAAANAEAQRPAATPAYIEGTARQASGLQSSTTLGSGHTKTAHGWLWQKSVDGTQWLPIKRLRDGSTYAKPLPLPVR